MKQHNLIVCGGTFDHFHKGHESLLKLAFSLGNRVLIGVTSNQYVRSSKLESGNLKEIEDFEKRKQSVSDFIKKEKTLDKIKLVRINDLFGPTLSRDLLIDAVVVSEDTKKGADIINQKRKESGLSLLKAFIVPSVNAEDGEPISSAKIRAGIISRAGKLYIKPSWLKADLILPENLRQEFKEPFGELLSDTDGLPKNRSNLIITVGDVTTKKFNENSVKQVISVVDFKVARREKFSSFSELGFEGCEDVITANNSGGHITSDLFNKISKIFKSDFKNRVILKIIGEEDLAVLPLILFSPLETNIYYGQPNKGLVKVIVSEEGKDKAYDLISKFRPI